MMSPVIEEEERSGRRKGRERRKLSRGKKIGIVLGVLFSLVVLTFPLWFTIGVVVYMGLAGAGIESFRVYSL